METAINIAMACNLIHPEMHLEKVELPDVAIDPSDTANREASLKKINDENRNNVESQLNEACSYEPTYVCTQVPPRMLIVRTPKRGIFASNGSFLEQAGNATCRCWWRDKACWQRRVEVVWQDQVVV